MGKSEPSDEDIRKWIKEGWKFTKRPRKGHVYITRRKGANLEKGHGRFNQSLWERIKKISQEPEEPQRDADPRSTFYFLLEHLRSSRYSRNCLHKDDEGYCTYWRWKNDLPLLRYGENLKMKEIMDEGKPVCLFHAHERYCSGCTAYVSEKMKTLKI